MCRECGRDSDFVEGARPVDEIRRVISVRIAASFWWTFLNLDYLFRLDLVDLHRRYRKTQDAANRYHGRRIKHLQVRAQLA